MNRFKLNIYVYIVYRLIGVKRGATRPHRCAAHPPHLPLRQGRLLADVLQRQPPPLRPRAPLADAGEQRTAAAGERLESCQLRHGEPTGGWGGMVGGATLGKSRAT